MIGQEFSIELFVRGGKVIFICVIEKKIIGVFKFIEIGYYNLILNYKDKEDEIKEFGKIVIKVLNIREGVFYCEVIFINEGLKVVECVNRCGGDNIMKLVENLYGIDLYRLIILNVLDFDFEVEVIKYNNIVIRFLFLYEIRYVNDIYFEEFDEKYKDKVFDYKILVKKGDIINKVDNFFDRFGYIIIEGNIFKEVDDVINYVLSKIYIE